MLSLSWQGGVWTADTMNSHSVVHSFDLYLLSSGSAAKGGAPKGGSSQKTSAGVDLRKLEDDDSDAPMKLPTASLELRIQLAQARTAKGLSQKDFAAKLMIPAKTIQEYESGKGIPQNGLIAKMERVLGCKLPRNSK